MNTPPKPPQGQGGPPLEFNPGQPLQSALQVPPLLNKTMDNTNQLSESLVEGVLAGRAFDASRLGEISQCSLGDKQLSASCNIANMKPQTIDKGMGQAIG